MRKSMLAKWVHVLDAALSAGGTPFPLFLAACTFDLVLDGGERIRHLEPTEAYQAVGAALGASAEEVQRLARVRARTLGSDVADIVREGEAALQRVARVARLEDTRGLSGAARDISEYTPDPVPQLVALPSPGFHWPVHVLRDHPFLSELKELWNGWLRAAKPSNAQWYRKLLFVHYPEFRAAARAGAQFATPPGSEYLRCVGEPLASSDQFAREMGPFLLYEWEHRADAPPQLGAAALRFIVSGDPAGKIDA